MAQKQGNGRNVAVPDENRPSWRPQDENVTARSRRYLDEDERDYDERDMRSWEDRAERRYGRDRDESRSTERYGIGQSGYGAGRYEDDRAMRWQSRNQGWDERDRMRDRDDDRFFGRGGGSWGYNPERYGAQGGYGGGHGFEDRGGYGHEGERMERNYAYGGGYLAQGGQQMGNEDGGRPIHGRRRERSMQDRYIGHRGKGPSGYIRSDERIRENICEMLTEDDRIDATNLEITVNNGEVTLSGTVDDRHTKRLVEDLVESCSGVKDVQNQIRVGEKKTASGKEIESTTQDKRHRA